MTFAEPNWHCEHERIAAIQRGALLENIDALGPNFEGRQADAILALKATIKKLDTRLFVLERALRNIRNCIGPQVPTLQPGAAEGMQAEIAEALAIITAVL